MTPGKIYVDQDYGPKGWFGLFLRNSPELYFGLRDDVWKWQVIGSSTVINHVKVNNYYNRREATAEELVEVYNILRTLNHTIDKTGKLVSQKTTILEVINKLKNNKRLNSLDRSFLINYINSHENGNL